VLNKALNQTRDNGNGTIKKIPAALNGNGNGKPTAKRLTSNNSEFFLWPISCGLKRYMHR
jgi:hypothetical protein